MRNTEGGRGIERGGGGKERAERESCKNQVKTTTGRAAHTRGQMCLQLFIRQAARSKPHGTTSPGQRRGLPQQYRERYESNKGSTFLKTHETSWLPLLLRHRHMIRRAYTTKSTTSRGINHTYLQQPRPSGDEKKKVAKKRKAHTPCRRSRG